MKNVIRIKNMVISIKDIQVAQVYYSDYNKSYVLSISIRYQKDNETIYYNKKENAFKDLDRIFTAIDNL